MVRQNWRSYSLGTCQDLGGWELGTTSNSFIWPNIYTYLSNNIHSYNCGYRLENESKIRKNESQIKRRNTSCYSGTTKQLHADHSQKPKFIHHQIKFPKKLDHPSHLQQHSSNNLQNYNSNIIANKNKKKSKNIQTINNQCITIKNVKFNTSATGYIKKKDRYRQIFGQKPKYMLIKLDSCQHSKKGFKLDNTPPYFRIR